MTARLEIICPAVYNVIWVVDFLFRKRERSDVLLEFVPEPETALLYRLSRFLGVVFRRPCMADTRYSTGSKDRVSDVRFYTGTPVVAYFFAPVAE
jgi:hypothetical protein